MIKIVLPPDVLAKLDQTVDVAEFCDSAGRIIGFFTPAGDSKDYEVVNPPTDEELEQAGKDLSGRPLAEILKDLEKRA